MRVNKAYYGGKRIARLYKGARLVKEFDTLPKGYVRLEYLRSEGGAYINSLVYPTDNMKIHVVCECSWPKKADSEILIGSRYNLDSQHLIWYNSTNGKDAMFCPNWDAKGDYVFVTGGGKFDLVLDSSPSSYSFSVNSKSYTCKRNKAGQSYPLLIFTMNDRGSVDDRYFKGWIYECQIWDNSKPIRDFIPCRNPQGACGLYDRVGKKFYGNSNRVGSFVGREPLKGDALTAGGKLIFNNGSLLIKNKK